MGQKRLRRDAGSARRNRRGRHTRAQGPTSRIVQKLEVEAKGLLDRQKKLKGVRSPRFGEHLQRFGEIRALQRELEAGEREATGQMDEYARKLRRLSRTLSDTGCLAASRAPDNARFP